MNLYDSTRSPIVSEVQLSIPSSRTSPVQKGWSDGSSGQPETYMTPRSNRLRIAARLLTGALALGLAGFAQAQDKLVVLTTWFAQAEHGGVYQAAATGIYKKHGLDVTVKSGGPQVNGIQLLLA